MNLNAHIKLAKRMHLCIIYGLILKLATLTVKNKKAFDFYSVEIKG